MEPAIFPDEIPQPLHHFSYWDIAYIQQVWNSENRTKQEFANMLNISPWEIDAALVLQPFLITPHSKRIIDEPKHLSNVASVLTGTTNALKKTIIGKLL